MVLGYRLWVIGYGLWVNNAFLMEDCSRSKANLTYNQQPITNNP